MFGLGFGELVVILVIVMVIFGAKRLPELGAGLGGMLRSFRQTQREPEALPPEALPPETPPRQHEA